MKKVFVIMQYRYAQYESTDAYIMGIYATRELADKALAVLEYEPERMSAEEAEEEMKTWLKDNPGYDENDYCNFINCMADPYSYSYSINEWDLIEEED